jgi:hypothetical protein
LGSAAGKPGKIGFSKKQRAALLFYWPTRVRPEISRRRLRFALAGSVFCIILLKWFESPI